MDICEPFSQDYLISLLAKLHVVCQRIHHRSKVIQLFVFVLERNFFTEFSIYSSFQLKHTLLSFHIHFHSILVYFTFILTLEKYSIVDKTIGRSVGRFNECSIDDINAILILWVSLHSDNWSSYSLSKWSFAQHTYFGTCCLFQIIKKRPMLIHLDFFLSFDRLFSQKTLMYSKIQ